MLFSGGFTYGNFLVDVLTVFMFVVWFWLLVMIFGDLIRRQDISGWLKAVWVIAVLMTSYLGILVYMITQGRGMAERNTQRAQAARDDLQRVVGFSVADEIAKLEKLQQSGSITAAEFARLRERLV
jgi:hypothetical protein